MSCRDLSAYFAVTGKNDIIQILNQGKLGYILYGTILSGDLFLQEVNFDSGDLKM